MGTIGQNHPVDTPSRSGWGQKNERLQKAGGSWGQFLSALPGAILNFFLLSEFSEPVHSPRHECYRAALPDMDGPSRCRHRGLCGAVRSIFWRLAIAITRPTSMSIFPPYELVEEIDKAACHAHAKRDATMRRRHAQPPQHPTCACADGSRSRIFPAQLVTATLDRSRARLLLPADPLRAQQQRA
jgi:hypothetical protein